MNLTSEFKLVLWQKVKFANFFFADLSMGLFFFSNGSKKGGHGARYNL